MSPILCIPHAYTIPTKKATKKHSHAPSPVFGFPGFQEETNIAIINKKHSFLIY